MSAAHPTVVKYLLDRFAAEGGERHRNRDGWGIVFTEERDAHVYREAEPAAGSVLARMVIDLDIPTRHLLAHVRRASHGKPRLANTHPFTRVRAGKAHHFAHNGTLHGIDDKAPALREQCVGDTDSELAFLLLLDALDAVPQGASAIDQRFAVFRDIAAQLAELGDANLLFYDGDTLFAHAHQRVFETDSGLTESQPPGLCIRYFGSDDEDGEADGHWHGAGVHITPVPPRMVLLASVPLNVTGWRPLPAGHALAIRDGSVLREASTRPSPLA